MTAFEQRLTALDITLFDAIRSQSTRGDKQSWLALQCATRDAHAAFAYLEIGSYLGGSLQPYLLDPRCRAVYSIDKRPAEVPDDRGQVFSYRTSSTGRMLENLRAIDAGQIGKIICFDAATREIEPAAVAVAPEICFIDGEHTRRAVLEDFAFCARVCASDAVIGFHDANVIYPAIADIIDGLRRADAPFTAAKLDGTTFVVALGASRVLADPRVRRLASDGGAFVRAMRARRRREKIGELVPAFLKPVVRKLTARSRGGGL
jgi:hypothetical protein